jgi:flagellar basal-body rod modification protein FlgD
MSIAPTTSLATAPQGGTDRTRLAQNFDTFLTLLTAQLRNQDPLNPTDSNEFTQQLVQYSQVEQQISMNESLQLLLSQSRTNALSSAIGYIGRTASLDAADLRTGSEGGSWRYTLGPGTTRAELMVRDEGGRVVRRAPAELNGGERTFAWDGRNDQGVALTPGRYSLTITASDATGAQTSSTISVRERIIGVDFSTNPPQLTTPSGQRALDRVVALAE